MSDYEELHRERTRAIEMQTEAIERQQEEIRRQREEAQQRYEEQQQKEKFNAALSECKYCGKKIPYDSTNNFYEYCSKRCVERDLGRDQYDNYMANGEKILSEQLDELIALGKGLAAAIISSRMTHFTAEQTVFLTKKFASNLPVIGNNPDRVIELLEPGFYSAPDTLKLREILAFYTGYNKRISRRVAGCFLTYLFQENPSVVKNCEETLRRDLLKILHNFSMDSEVKNTIFLILLLQEMASMKLERKKAFAINLLSGNGDYDIPNEVCWNIIDRIFKFIGNSDTDFSEKVYDLAGESCGWAKNAESETLNEIINSRQTEIQLKEEKNSAWGVGCVLVIGVFLLYLFLPEDYIALALMFVFIFALKIIVNLRKISKQIQGVKPNLLKKVIDAQCDQAEAFAVDDIAEDDIDFDSSRQAAEAAIAPVAVAVPAPVAVAAPVQEEAAPQVIEFYCIHCGGSITTDAENAGAKGECPYCQRAVTVPTKA